MDAIVTGGAGFIGSHVADALLARGDRVVVVDNLAGGRRDRLPEAAEFQQIDIRDRDAMRRVFDQLQPEAVFHLAAQADVRVSVDDPWPRRRRQRAGHDRGAGSRRSTGARVVFSSTGGALYGDADTIPSPETTPVAPMAPYGTSKYCAEQYLGFSTTASTAGNHVILRYGNVYGPRQDPHGEGGVVAIFFGRLQRGHDAADLRQRPADARLRARGRRGGGQPGGGRLRRRRAGLQHRHRDRDERGRSAGRGGEAVAGTNIAAEHRPPRPGRARPQQPRLLAGAQRTGLAAAGEPREGLRETLAALHP